MPLVLHDRDGHTCVMYSDLDDSGGEAVQANQFLLVDDGHGALIDPGGNLAYNGLFLGMSRHFAPQRLEHILASHADPDIIASLDRWMTATPATVHISDLWVRFAPHFCKPGKTDGRIAGIPDAGARIPFGRGEIWALPAHFLHAEGNFQFWDPASRLLFSGDLGVSLGGNPGTIVTELQDVLPRMAAFHQRYMVSGKVLRLWADMVSTLPIRMIVPQHGAPLSGRAVSQFIDWVRTLDCGIDRFGPQHYRLPA